METVQRETWTEEQATANPDGTAHKLPRFGDPGREIISSCANWH